MNREPTIKHAPGPTTGEQITGDQKMRKCGWGGGDASVGWVQEKRMIMERKSGRGIAKGVKLQKTLRNGWLMPRLPVTERNNARSLTRPGCVRSLAMNAKGRDGGAGQT